MAGAVTPHVPGLQHKHGLEIMLIRGRWGKEASFLWPQQDPDAWEVLRGSKKQSPKLGFAPWLAQRWQEPVGRIQPVGCTHGMLLT